MSNTSTVTPYESTNQGSSVGTGAAAAGAVVGAAALALAGTAVGVYGVYRLGRWLAKSPELSAEQLDEISLIEQEFKDEMSQMKTADAPAFASLNLHLKDAETLVHTANSLGYRLIDATDGVQGDAAAPLLLERGNGQRLAITRNEHERLAVHTSANQSLLFELVSRHTEDRVLSHLAEKGMDIQTARLSSGELQILSRETDTQRTGDAAEIKAQVRPDGTAWVDIDRCRGRRCEHIVAGIADAMGGTVDDTAKKDAWFQLPGEPTRTRVKT